MPGSSDIDALLLQPHLIQTSPLQSYIRNDP